METQLKTYRVIRSMNGGILAFVFDGHPDEPTKVESLNHLPLHSPGGFETGYRGSGPADLALAILADHLGNVGQAINLHQAFKDKVIAEQQLEPGKHYDLDTKFVEEWIEQQFQQPSLVETGFAAVCLIVIVLAGLMIPA